MYNYDILNPKDNNTILVSLEASKPFNIGDQLRLKNKNEEYDLFEIIQITHVYSLNKYSGTMKLPVMFGDTTLVEVVPIKGFNR